MAKRQLTVLFGANTSKLTKALGGLRKKISGAFKGMLSLKGMAAAGIGGFGLSQAIGLMMNLSPAFANAMLKLKEPLMNVAAALADTIAPHIQDFADYLSSNSLVDDLSQWWEDMKTGFGIVVDFIMDVPDMLKDGFKFIWSALSDIYDAAGILLRQFDKYITKKIVENVVPLAVGASTAVAASQARGEGVGGQIGAAAISLFSPLLSGSTRTETPGTVGADNR